MNEPSREDRLLEAEDGRFFAIGKTPVGQKVEGGGELGPGLAMRAGVERVGPARVPVSFGLPSAPAMFLNLSHKAFSSYRGVNVYTLFDKHPQGIWPDTHTPLFNYFESFSAHVVFAFTALESFANELLPEGVAFEVTEEGGSEKRYTREDVERKASLEQKLAQYLPEALNTLNTEGPHISTPKGLHIWRDFKKLKKTRDRLIHLKAIDRSRKADDKTPTIWADMLNSARVPFCDQAHELMGHYGAAVTERRWYKKYPY